MDRRGSLITGALVGLGAGAVSLIALAGPLGPPAGPVSPTYKTLTEVEPRTVINRDNTPGDADSLYKITRPGSYYLAGDVMGQAGQSGIEIASSNVTIDLMGFRIQGVAGSLSGIVSPGPITYRYMTIRNGMVTGWGGSGIDLFPDVPSAVDGMIIQGVHASNNGVHGIRAGVNAVITDCTASNNADSGIYTWSHPVIERCIVSSNGVDGIRCGGYAAVRGCTASLNGSVGIAPGAAASVAECTAESNGIAGIAASTSSTVTHCTALVNDGDGIAVGQGSIVSHCTSDGNEGDGIQIQNHSVVRENCCRENGTTGSPGAGIRVSSVDNRIEGNHVRGNDVGIDVDAVSNLIICNTACTNTVNYDFIANNRYGPIVNITASGTAAVSGNSAASTAGSTDPWANFAY